MIITAKEMLERLLRKLPEPNEKYDPHNKQPKVVIEKINKPSDGNMAKTLKGENDHV